MNAQQDTNDTKTDQRVGTEKSESKPDPKKLLSMRGVMVLLGLTLGWIPCIGGFLAGAVAAMVWIRWEQTSPPNMVKKGISAGLLAGIGGLLVLVLFSLILWAIDPETTTSNLIWSTFSSVLFILLFSAGTGALTGFLMRKQRQTAGVRKTPTMQSKTKLLPRLSDFGYLPLEPVAGRVTVACPSCKTEHRVATFSGILGTAENEKSLEIARTEQKLKGLPASWHKSVYWVGVISLGLILGWGSGGFTGFFVAGVMAAIIGTVVWVVVGPLLQWLFGNSAPIWLVSCFGCRARIPVATDGGAFWVADKTIPPEIENTSQIVPETEIPHPAPETTPPPAEAPKPMPETETPPSSPTQIETKLSTTPLIDSEKESQPVTGAGQCGTGKAARPLVLPDVDFP